VNVDGVRIPNKGLLPNLSARQLALFKALGDINDGSLARIYLGAVYVLIDLNNPDRFSLAAHNYRELLTVLPTLFGIDVTPFHDNVDYRIVNLAEDFEKIQQNLRASDSENKVVFNQRLKKFLAKLNEFFEWYKQINPRRKDVRAQTLRNLDPAPVNLPKHIEDELLQEWQDFYSYFTRIAHHKGMTPPDDFANKVDSFENFLILRIKPQVFSDIKEIDELIKQAESND